MKKTSLILSFLLLVSGGAMAQKHDPVPGDSMAEKGAQGDFLLGKEAKKNQLLDTPQKLQVPDSSQKKDVHSKKKRARHKKINQE